MVMMMVTMVGNNFMMKLPIIFYRRHVHFEAYQSVTTILNTHRPTGNVSVVKWKNRGIK